MLGSFKRQLFWWIIYTGYLWSFAILTNSKADFVTFLFVNVILYGVFYYNLYVLFPILFEKKRKILFVILFISGLILYYIVRLHITNQLLPALGIGQFKSPADKKYFTGQAFMYFQYAIYALLFWYVFISKKTERLLRITEKARLEAEFNHLRTQINPHFLFNTLNTFYSQSLMALPDTARGISLLSKIMRYSLNPPGKDGKVPLEDEITHVNDYIELMQIRLPGKLQITNNLPTETEKGWQILPHVLITLVENAFKHGSREHPFLFNLQLSNNTITFRVENTIGESPVAESSGVGLRNLKERLQLIYGKNCTFEEGPENGMYKSTLVIQNAFFVPVTETEKQETPVPLFN